MGGGKKELRLGNHILYKRDQNGTHSFLIFKSAQVIQHYVSIVTATIIAGNYYFVNHSHLIGESQVLA